MHCHMTEKKANAMIKEIAKWLKDGAPGAKEKSGFDTVAAQTAREMCSTLLAAADVDNMGGCDLCCS